MSFRRNFTAYGFGRPPLIKLLCFVASPEESSAACRLRTMREKFCLSSVWRSPQVKMATDPEFSFDGEKQRGTQHFGPQLVADASN